MPTSSGRLLRDGQFPGSKTLSAIALDPPRSFSFLKSYSYSVFFRRVRLRPNRDLRFQCTNLGGGQPDKRGHALFPASDGASLSTTMRPPRRTQGRPDKAIPLGKIKDGTEYEDEFEYDWGTIARFEPLLGRAMPTFSGRLLREGPFPPAQKRSLRSPSTLLAPSRSPIVLELVLVLGFFSVGRGSVRCRGERVA